jgi:hypothetical protein
MRIASALKGIKKSPCLATKQIANQIAVNKIETIN